MLQVGFRQAPTMGPSQAEGPHALRERPCDPRATLSALPPVRTGIPGLGCLERFKVLLRRKMEAAPCVLGMGVEGLGTTGAAVLETAAHDRIRLAPSIDILPPHG